MNILKISSAIKSFNNCMALNNLNLSLEEGIILGLVGPNGAGKTTAINAISNILKLDEGDILIFGEDSRSKNIEMKRKMGILYDDFQNLFPYLKGDEFLYFVGEVYGLKKELIKKE